MQVVICRKNKNYGYYNTKKQGTCQCKISRNKIRSFIHRIKKNIVYRPDDQVNAYDQKDNMEKDEQNSCCERLL